jgi:hypothetical protein
MTILPCVGRTQQRASPRQPPMTCSAGGVQIHGGDPGPAGKMDCDGGKSTNEACVDSAQGQGTRSGLAFHIRTAPESIKVNSVVG